MAAYIKFDGVDGEATDRRHIKWSELISFEQSLHNPGSQIDGTRQSGKVILDDIKVIKKLDRASHEITRAACEGKIFPEVNIEATAPYADAINRIYYTYELSNVLVTGYTIHGGGDLEEDPVEEITLNFERIKVTYIMRNAGGAKKGEFEYTWNVRDNTA